MQAAASHAVPFRQQKSWNPELVVPAGVQSPGVWGDDEFDKLKIWIINIQKPSTDIIQTKTYINIPVTIKGNIHKLLKHIGTTSACAVVSLYNTYTASNDRSWWGCRITSCLTGATPRYKVGSFVAIYPWLRWAKNHSTLQSRHIYIN